MIKLACLTAVLGAATLLAAPVALVTPEAGAAPRPCLSGKVLEMALNVGNTATISLPSNSSTGYQWQLAEPLPESAAVGVTVEIVHPKNKETGEPVCGAPDETQVTVTAKSEGSADVKLVYVRPGEKDAQVQDIRVICVIVSK